MNQKDPFAESVIVRANYFQFSRGQIISYSCVGSRMLVWCKQGHGSITTEDRTHQMKVGDFVWTSWKHSIRYAADHKSPFLVGCIHVVPRYTDKTLSLQIPHNRLDILHHSILRQDFRVDPFKELPSNKSFTNSSLIHLCEFLVRRFEEKTPELKESRVFARILLTELKTFLSAKVQSTSDLPPSLQKILVFLENQHFTAIDLDTMSSLVQLSRSAVGRMFRQHLNATPIEYLIRKRMLRAQKLLTQTNMKVAEVGRHSGYDDCFYFSKLFKKYVGCTPMEYRRKSIV